MPDFELKPGPELDAAIAKACGIKGRIISPPSEFCMATSFLCYDLTEEGGFPRVWQPSIDHKAAFEAAEKVRLFQRGFVNLHFVHDDNPWQIDYDPGDDEQYAVLGNGTTPALAICAAILALVELAKSTAREI